MHLIRQSRDELEQWLGQRRQLITASDVAAVLGYNPYVTRAKIAEEKLTGNREDLTGRAKIEAGTFMERGTLEWWLEHQPEGTRLWHNQERRMFYSPVLPYLACTPDGWTEDSDGRPIEIVEAKCVGYGAVWTKQPEFDLQVPCWSTAHAEPHQMPKGPLVAPAYYAVQLLTQLHCCEVDAGVIVVLAGGAARYELRYQRDRGWENKVLIPGIQGFRDELAAKGLVL